MPAVAHEQLRDRYAQSCRQVFSSKFDQLLGWGSTASPFILEIMLTTDRKIITGTGIITALLSRLRLYKVICVSYKADRSRSLSFGDLGHQACDNLHCVLACRMGSSQILSSKVIGDLLCEAPQMPRCCCPEARPSCMSSVASLLFIPRVGTVPAWGRIGCSTQTRSSERDPFVLQCWPTCSSWKTTQSRSHPCSTRPRRTSTSTSRRTSTSGKSTASTTPSSA